MRFGDTRFNHYERIVLSVASGLMLLAWIAFFFADLNHPPGVRSARLLGAALVLFIGGIEFVFPWIGFCLLLLFWPQFWIFREVLTENVSQIFGALPAITGGPLAAALSLALFVRTSRELRSEPPHQRQEASAPFPLAWLRSALWLMAVFYVLSGLLSFSRLLNGAPAGWSVDPPDWRHLSAPTVYSALVPLISILRVLPDLCLGLLLLNLLGSRRVSSTPMALILRAAAISASLFAAEWVVQWCLNRPWRFDEHPLGGAFNNRNTMAPVSLVFALLCFALASKEQSRSRLWLGLGGLLTFLACAVGSRNGMFAALVLGTLLFIAWARWTGVLLALVFYAIVSALVFYLPLPKPGSLSISMSRLVETLMWLRSSDWGHLTSYRNELYAAAWAIFASSPLTGTGPGTFPMQAGHSLLYTVTHKTSTLSAHSMPMTLLAETGVFAALAWSAAWLAVPARMAFRSARRQWLWWAVLTIGIANVLDTVWLTAGMTTTSMLILFSACAETEESADVPKSL